MSISFSGYVRISIALAACASSAAWASDREFERTVPAQPDGQVEISTVAGEVSVSGWDQPQIEVKGVLSSRVERVDVTSEGSRAAIKVVMQSGLHGEARLTIHVPKRNAVEIAAVSADIRTDNVLGEQRLRTVSGNIDAQLHGADTETKTVSGDTLLHGDRKQISVRSTSVSGDIHYENGAGGLEAATVSGDLMAALEPGTDIRLRTTSGDATLNGKLAGAASIDAETISGELIVRMKTDSGYRYEVSSFSGDITDCWDVKAERSSRYGPGSRLTGERGVGKGEVRLKTMSGDVEICDR